MESVILAAGRGQRMEGFAKPFYKPLLELNGIPLINYAIGYAEAVQCERVTIVVSPSNMDDIKAATAKYGEWVTLAVQEYPLGPGHAAMVGLELVDAQKTMLLMSDNIMNVNTVIDMANAVSDRNCDAVGVRFVDKEAAARFTRVRVQTSGTYSYVEGGELLEIDMWPSTQSVAVWCGPLIFGTATARNVFERALVNARIVHDGAEIKIGPNLDQILQINTELFDVEAFDVGIPTAYLSQVSGAQ